MPTSIETAAARERLAAAGLGPVDLAWFDQHGWNDADIPPPEPNEIAAYERREAALNSAIAGLGITERGRSLEGRLAAAIGARLADLRDRDEDAESISPIQDRFPYIRRRRFDSERPKAVDWLQFIAVSVRDDGIGILPEMQSRILVCSHSHNVFVWGPCQILLLIADSRSI